MSIFSKKLFLLSGLLCFSACQFWQSSNVNSNNSTVSIKESQNEFPFSTKEPENFQADYFFSDLDNGERKISVFRAGKQLRLDYEDQSSSLQLNENSSFLLHHQHRIYAEQPLSSSTSEKNPESLQDFLTTEWLNQKTDARFENLGNENGLLKFRVSFSESEVLLYFDENLQLPVKQEFLAVFGEQKDVLYRSEMKNFKSPADTGVFEIPKNYRQVSLTEYQQILWKEKAEEKHENK